MSHPPSQLALGSHRLHPLVLAVLLDPLHDARGSPLPVEIQRDGGLVPPVELDGRESLDVHAFDLVLRRVHLGQQDVGVSGQQSRCFLEVGRQLLAVAAPRRVELHQHLLLGVQHQFLEGRCHDYLHWLVVGLGNRRRLEVKSDFAPRSSLHEGLQALRSDLPAIVAVLVEAAGEVDDLRASVSPHAQVLGQPLKVPESVIPSGEREDERGIGLAVRAECLERACSCCFVAEEEEERWVFLLEDLVDCGVVEGDDCSGAEEEEQGKKGQPHSNIICRKVKIYYASTQTDIRWAAFPQHCFSLLCLACSEILNLVMINRALAVRRLLRRSLAPFADDNPKNPSVLDSAELDLDVKSELKKKFTGEVIIEEKYHKKTSALYDRYMQVREKPIVCHDGLQLAYEFVIERLPIFEPYQQRSFEAYRNRYVYAKKTGFYVEIPKDLKLETGDYPFKDYDEANEENAVSHQISLSQTEKINYRENSRLWRYTDPSITDPHSVQTHSSNHVFLIVKEKGKWVFPTKMLSQKDNHTNIFNFMTSHLFQHTKYPVVHFPSKKPMGVRRATFQGVEKQVRVLTFHGISAFGVPKYPTAMFEDYAWVPKAHLANYFEDEYHEAAAWAATEQF